MAQTRIRIGEQLQTSTNPRSILITDSNSKPSYFPPSAGVNRLLMWNDSTSQWDHATLGTNLSWNGTAIDAAAGAGGYSAIQEEGSTVGAGNTTMNFIGSGITAANAGAGVTSITLNSFLNTLATSGSVNLASHVSGDLPYSNLAQGSALSVLGVTGNAIADNASIVANSDHQVLRRSGTSVAFGAINLAQSTAVTGVLAATNGGTGYGTYAVGDLLYANTTSTLDRRAAVATGSVLKSAGVNTAPVWGTLSTSDLTDGANIAHINATETISAVWTFNPLPESSAAPTTGNQFTNKTYVDSLIANQRKLSVRAATTVAGGNITLSGTQTIDTVALIAGDRVLVKNQTAPAQNGIYVVAAGAWSRATDMDAASEVDGTFVVVEDGAQAGSLWLTVSEVTNLGTDSIVWTEVNKATDLVAGAGITPTGLTWDIVKADDSLTINANDMAVRLHTTGGLETIASNGIRIKSDTGTAATVGITTTANGAGIRYDSNSFTDTSEILALANGVAGNGLALNTGVLSVNVDGSTIEINADSLRVKDAGITFAKIQNVNEDRLLGRDSGTLGAPEEISLTAGIGFIGSNTKTIGHTTTGASSVTHTNAQVPSAVTIDANGHVTGFTTRNLNLSNLADVTITTPSSNQVLTYNGSVWVNQAAQGGTTVRAFVEGSTSSSIDLDANTGVVKDVNGNNVAFTVPSDTLKFFVYRNGIRQMETGGAPGNTTRDYSVNTTTHVLTLTYALTADEVLMVEKLN